jgi:tetratricopeptide (TPR) repeat protein
MRPRWLPVAAACLGVLCGAPRPAGAQRLQPGVTYQQWREGKRLFNQGHLAYRRGDYEEAILKWEKSFELSREPLIFESISKAYEALGDTERALDYLRKWREKAPTKEHKQLDAKIENLDVRYRREQEEERKKREAEEAKKRELEERQRKLEEQERLARERERAAAEGSAAREALAIVGWSLVGVGATAAIVGGALDLVAVGKRPDPAEACTEAGGQLLCRASERDAIEQSDTLALAGDITWISGAVMVVSGAIILIATQTGSDEPSEKSGPAPRVLPLVGVRGWRGRFDFAW